MATLQNVSEAKLDGIVSIVNATSQGKDVSDSVDADPPNVGIIFHENSSVVAAVAGGSPPAQNTSNSYQLVISEKPIINGTISNVSDLNPHLPVPDGGVRGSENPNNGTNPQQLVISEKPIINGTVSNVSDSNPPLLEPDEGVRGSENPNNGINPQQLGIPVETNYQTDFR
ncbi:hypothetical protein QJS10_CPB12g00300 [Acorus calamus]|uniref:Uncharacterized protein n=1 Tax=Acorus calamus TaxID=4465 RepID=A0AAV9DKK4_ACOCL|nr:hypothetical protein QJS10_CPB12g00300 [Acorus calamus]